MRLVSDAPEILQPYIYRMHFFMLSMGRTFISYELIKLYLLSRLGGSGIVDSAALLSLYCSVITYDGYQKPEFL